MFVILKNTSNLIIVTKYKDGSPHIFCKLPIVWTAIRGVIGWSCLRAVTKFRIDRMPLLVVTYPVNNNALTSLFIARKTLNLSCSIVVISHHFTIRISHRLHTVPAIIGSTIDISPNICHTRHNCTYSLRHLTLSTVVVGFTATRILHEGKTTSAIILIASLTIGISDTIKEVFWIKYLMESLEVVGNNTLIQRISYLSWIWL